jgi:hypothetical protein
MARHHANSVSFVNNGSTFAVMSPYDRTFPKFARGLGGDWDAANKLWVFPSEREAEVRKLCVDIYGEHALAPVAIPAAVIAAQVSVDVRADDGRRRNGKPGMCHHCQGDVEVGQGFIYREWSDDAERFVGPWLVECANIDGCKARFEEGRRLRDAERETARAAALVSKAEKEVEIKAYDAFVKKATQGFHKMTVAPVNMSDKRNPVLKSVSDGPSIYRALLETEFGFMEVLDAGDDNRTSFYVRDTKTANDAYRAWCERVEMTSAKANEWLSKYADCYGADAYRWASANLWATLGVAHAAARALRTNSCPCASPMKSSTTSKRAPRAKTRTRSATLSASSCFRRRSGSASVASAPPTAATTAAAVIPAIACEEAFYDVFEDGPRGLVDRCGWWRICWHTAFARVFVPNVGSSPAVLAHSHAFLTPVRSSRAAAQLRDDGRAAPSELTFDGRALVLRSRACEPMQMELSARRPWGSILRWP